MPLKSRAEGDTAATFDWLHQPPPVHRINLSLPPVERYVELARLYRDPMRSLRGTFDELVSSLSSKIPLGLVHRLARTFLRRLSTSEETEELRGISRATDIDLYLLICFNTVLDLLMGCTSGGVRTKHGSETRILHFRTLDWGMEKLRPLIVQLEFVRDDDPEKVLATSVSYAGFVGVLTGVRKDLSMSLNFRPVHDTSKNLAFYLNHLLVLLGRRPSISSLLRQCLVPSSSNSKRLGWVSKLPTLYHIMDDIPSQPTTAAYLIFSDGQRTVTMEKDVKTAITRFDRNFIVVTNNDQDSAAMPSQDAAKDKESSQSRLALVSEEPLSMEELIEDSKERRACMQKKWDHKMKQNQRDRARKETREPLVDESPKETNTDQPGVRSSLRLRQKAAERQKQANLEIRKLRGDSDGSDKAITPEEALSWLTTFPIVNEDTHYATLMDPSEGTLFWVSLYNLGQISA
ncbi:beta subunit of N-acylethanolamine-hydrolyzing acid amidase-domain-containing protein [Penicillium manginii]|uniref:beta subunit of N-acylethanolamine-hydrolyzing acid amidase-domain-containing protein n=1 Tax=Penicillium manginii TaxID=203109 RepID=UPI002547E88B|nr:beta subunit of N-acylethanolamine-hydrolyzing acid amidase-domain-containing protein [Penicillium manginii]KAJ5742885.1 beta subunit of N-acylethanolamine-hydrolyzing acid amidase-domain-containing protein [Penicillium manginii]